jgi:hypothetical protein
VLRGLTMEQGRTFLDAPERGGKGK